MSNTKDNKHGIIFCWVNGEPTLYNTATREYFQINLDYDKVLEMLKVEIQKQKTRPQMRMIWRMLSNLINCCTKYNEYYNKKEFINYDSFESRITRDITKFVDTLFKKGLTQEEHENLEKAKNWLKEKNSMRDTSLKRFQFLKRMEKKGRKLY